LDLEEQSKNWQLKNKSIYHYWDAQKKLKKAKKEFESCPVSSNPLVADIKKAFQEKKKLKNFKIIGDVREYDEHQTGGSGGLSRFWVDVKDNDDNEDIIEFKTLTTNPGTGLLWSPNPVEAARIKWCTTNLWPKVKRRLDLEVLCGDNTYFEVRSRVKKTLKAKSDEEKMELWKIQLEIMVARHYDGWKGQPYKELKTWLLNNSAYIAQRYTNIFQNCKTTLNNA